MNRMLLRHPTADQLTIPYCSIAALFYCRIDF
jgi:hypothetical protein